MWDKGKYLYDSKVCHIFILFGFSKEILIIKFNLYYYLPLPRYKSFFKFSTATMRKNEILLDIDFFVPYIFLLLNMFNVTN